MIVGIISIILAVIAILPCFSPGAMSVIGVFISLLSLLIACLSTFERKIKYLIWVLFIVTFNIFVVSEFSFAVNKNLYSHRQPLLRKIIHLITYNDEDQIKEKLSKKALEKYLGYEIIIDYKRREKGYWNFVKIVILITFIPYFLSFLRLYSVLRLEKP